MPRITAPTLVVVGEQDNVVPASYGNEFASRIPGAAVHTMAGAGHMMMLEQPQEFAEVARGFLCG